MSDPTAQVRAFARDGYVVLPGAVPAATCDALNARLSGLIARVGDEHTRGERQADFWRQMPRSAHEVEVFWHADAPRFDEAHVQRVGHGLHLHEPLFAELALRSAAAAMLSAVLGGEARLVQSAVVYKQPRSDVVQFGQHQDAAYLPTSRGGLALAFVALDPMDAVNGALQVVPGSHRLGQGEVLSMGPGGFSRVAGSSPRWMPHHARLLPLARGDVVLVHGWTYHASDPNRSDRPRRALILHAMAGDERLTEACWVPTPPAGFAPIAASPG